MEPHIHFYALIQNDGEINYFTVNKLNNDNDKPENLWTLHHQVSEEWAEGRVDVSSEGDKEYQVTRIFYRSYISIGYFLLNHGMDPV